MQYHEILEHIAKEESCSTQQIENEIENALKQAYIPCSAEKLLNIIKETILEMQ